MIFWLITIIFIITIIISVIIIIWYFFIKLVNKKKYFFINLVNKKKSCVNECSPKTTLEGITTGLFLDYISTYEKEPHLNINKPIKSGLNNHKVLWVISVLVVLTIFFLILLSWSICANMSIGPVISKYSSSSLFSSGFVLLATPNEIEQTLTFTDYIPSLSNWEWVGITLAVTVSSVVLFTGYVAYNLSVGPVLPDSFSAIWSSGIVFDNNLAEANSVINSLLDSVVDQVEASSVVDSLLDSVVDQVEASSVINSLLNSVVDQVNASETVVSVVPQAVAASLILSNCVDNAVAGPSSVIDNVPSPSSVVGAVADSSSVVSTLVEASYYGVKSIMDQAGRELYINMLEEVDIILTAIDLSPKQLEAVNELKVFIGDFQTAEAFVLWCIEEF